MKALLLIAAGSTAAVLAFGPEAALVDPRSGGLQVAMGEWTVTLEAQAIRPGSVTFVVVNRGRFAHGFRVRSAGSGKDRFEARTSLLEPGEKARLTVDLSTGVYRAECFVEDGHGDHADRGMRVLLDVRPDAPLVKPRPKPSAKRPIVNIEAFAFRPTPFKVVRGTTVRWVNRDATAHTVTAASGSFSSGRLGEGQAFTHRFARAGSYRYLCAIHPSMKASLVVR